MKQPKYILYTKHAWQNGLAALSTHDTKEQAQQAALELIRSRGIKSHSEGMQLACDYVIAYGQLETGREYGMPMSTL